MEQNFLIFQEMETLKKFLYFRKQLSKLKKIRLTFKIFFMFQEMELSSLKLKKLRIFQEELQKSEKPEKVIIIVSIFF